MTGARRTCSARPAWPATCCSARSSTPAPTVTRSPPALAGLGVDGYALTFERVQRAASAATWANVVVDRRTTTTTTTTTTRTTGRSR